MGLGRDVFNVFIALNLYLIFSFRGDDQQKMSSP